MFQIDLTVDITLADDERKKAFIDLVTQQARSLYAVSAVLTKKRPPEMNVTMIDGDGKSNLKIME
jgi:hypothetical protein